MRNEYEFLSELEKKVYNWLVRHDISFSTQVPMFGGSQEVGGATVDFILPDRNIVLRCMGSYWHSSLEAKARDLLGKERLIARGYIVVDLHEENLTDDRIGNTMELALQGQEALR